jgi:hypothetical protein
VGRAVSATFVAALALAAFLAGCGGGNGSTSSTRTVKATPPSRSTTGATPSPDAYWPYRKLVARLAGRTVTVASARVRLDPALLECSGDGAARRIGSTRGWSRYICTQTIFQGGGDHDVTFDVLIASSTQLRLTSARNGPD